MRDKKTRQLLIYSERLCLPFYTGCIIIVRRTYIEGMSMSDNFERFVSESTELYKNTLTEQIRISEDVNKYSVWLLGLSTAGIAVLVVRFGEISKASWIQSYCIKSWLIIAGILFLVSIFFGAWHQRSSITERTYYRVLIMMFGMQNLVPYFKHPDYPTDKIPEDMHQKISDGQLLNSEEIPKFEGAKKQAKELNRRLSFLLNTQQLLAGIGYVLLFLLSIAA